MGGSSAVRGTPSRHHFHSNAGRMKFSRVAAHGLRRPGTAQFRILHQNHARGQSLVTACAQIKELRTINIFYDDGTKQIVKLASDREFKAMLKSERATAVTLKDTHEITYSFFGLRQDGDYKLVRHSRDEAKKTITIVGRDESITKFNVRNSNEFQLALSTFGVQCLVHPEKPEERIVSYHDLNHGSTYQLPTERSISFSKQVQEVSKENSNRVKSYEDCFQRKLVELATERYHNTGATVEELPKRLFKYSSGKCAVEIDAGVLVHHSSGKLTCILGEHKSTLTVASARELTIKKSMIWRILSGDSETSTDISTVFKGIQAFNDIRLVVAGDRVVPTEDYSREETLELLEEEFDTVLHLNSDKWAVLAGGLPAPA